LSGIESYIEFALSRLEELGSRPGVMLMLLAALPLVPLIVRVSAISLISVGIVAGGMGLLSHGVDPTKVTVLVISSSAFLIAADASLTRRRLSHLELSLASAMDALRRLELSEERRQVLVARQLFGDPAGALPNSRSFGSESTAAGPAASQSSPSSQATQTSEENPKARSPSSFQDRLRSAG
jgi:hypothetical protein